MKMLKTRIHNIYLIDAFIFLTYMVFGASWAAGGSLMGTIQKELSLSMSEGSFLTTSITIAKIVGALGAGLLVSKFGFKRAFGVGAFLISLSVLSGLTNSYLSLLLLRFVMGLGSAICLVCLVPIVQQLFELRLHSTMNGINAVSNIIGTIVALLISPLLLEIFHGWRAVLTFYGAISLIIAILWVFTEPRIFSQQAAISQHATVEYYKKAQFKKALTSSVTWGMFCFYFFPICFLNTSFTFYPLYFKQVLHLPSSSLASYSATLINCGILVGGITGNSLRNLILHPKKILISAILGAVTCGIVNLIATNANLVALCALMSGVFIGTIIPIFFTIPSYAPDANPIKTSYIMSIFWSCTFICVTFNIWFIGYLGDVTGNLISGFIYMFCLSVLSLIGITIIPTKKHEKLNT